VSRAHAGAPQAGAASATVTSPGPAMTDEPRPDEPQPDDPRPRSSRLGSQLARQEVEELARAIRTLLRWPLLTAVRDPDAFELVRRHGERLITWFEEHCGWPLVVEPRRGYARLRKLRSDPDPSRPARRARSTRAPFDRRRYTLLCMVAAELARPGAMTTIGLLAQRVTAATAAEPAIPTFDPTVRDERAAYVDAIKLLEQYGVVQALDGSTDAFVDQAGAKVLYQVDETRLARLLAAPVSPSQLGGQPDLDGLIAERRYGDAADPGAEVAESQRNLWLRHTITRRVLDDPVVYLDDLTEAQRAYLGTLTGRRLVRQAAHDAGFTLEERADGLLAVDEDRIATDTTFPDDRSHVKHAALLLLDALVAAGRAGLDGVPTAELTARVESLLGRFPTWGRSYQSEDGPARLTREAVGLLCDFGLAARRDGMVAALPAARRYGITAPTAPATLGASG
jgi:uncharacterized protein (TIGR02678 family)